MSTGFRLFIRNPVKAGHFGYPAWNQSHGCAKMSALINKVAAEARRSLVRLMLKN
ncbi:MAG TPA: hypothetical protein VM943_01940 [Pyrinomonadaceae bacterium]|nr:hypothetical protein [Pyrinomonadaceae bacterium]